MPSSLKSILVLVGVAAGTSVCVVRERAHTLTGLEFPANLLETPGNGAELEPATTERHLGGRGGAGGCG